MADYIDREELLKALDRNSIYRKITYGDGRNIGEIIEDMPSVDAVEVVRCKDCKHNIAGFCAKFERIMPSGQQGGTRHEWHKVNDTDYCKWGEKE